MAGGIHKMGKGNNQEGHETKGNGNAERGAAQLVRQVAWNNDRAQSYAFPGRSEAEASDVVRTCTIIVCDRMASGIHIFDLMCLLNFPWVLN